MPPDQPISLQSQPCRLYTCAETEGLTPPVLRSTRRQAISLAQGVAEQALGEQRQVLAAERAQVAALEDKARQDAAQSLQQAYVENLQNFFSHAGLQRFVLPGPPRVALREAQGLRFCMCARRQL
jgi:hypothetical protein